VGIERLISSNTISGFVTSSIGSGRCVRCGASVNPARAFTKNRSDDPGHYAVIGQVDIGAIQGGVLCSDCVASFRRWIGVDDD
jgi:hypothetical protein